MNPLKASATLWFIVAAAGQWLFAYYVVVVFGVRVVADGLAGLSQVRLMHGYVAGDTIGNVASTAHILLAIVIHGGGPMQLIPHIRHHAPAFHRWNGRAFLSAVLVSTLFGLYLQWLRGASQGPADIGGNTVASILTFIFGALALRHAMARNFDVHRRWALRLFLVASAVWFIRLGSYGSQFLERAFDMKFAPAYYESLNAAKILVPLGVLELYFWAQRSAGMRGRTAVATVIVVMTMLTAVGIYGAATIKWLPAIRG
jgi:Predicted membrane protein (DUF2306)